jgi:hypothetical protein
MLPFPTFHRSSYQKPLCEDLLTKRLKATAESQDPKPCRAQPSGGGASILSSRPADYSSSRSLAHPRFQTDIRNLIKPRPLLVPGFDHPENLTLLFTISLSLTKVVCKHYINF